MQDIDMPAFMEILAWMSELYGKALSVSLMDIYWKVLNPFELQEVKQAFEFHIYNPDGGQYFPKPADIVRWIEGPGETKALRAWTIVECAMRRVGKYQSIAFDDWIIHAVLEEMGGWVTLCSMTEKEAPFCALQFQKRYLGYVHKPPKRYPKYLWGISECENAKNGYAIKPLVLVGNAKKAEQVMLKGGGVSLMMQEATQSMVELIQQLPFVQMNSGKDKS